MYYYEIEHLLMIIGIFGAGMLAMLGIMIGVDMHRKSRAPRVPLTRGYDPRNPINRMGELTRQFATEEDGWFEVRPIEWR